MTIKDIAKKTGYSLSTISKYINGGRVKKNYAENIRKVIEEMNFKPNYFAKALRSNKSYTIGVLVPMLDNLFSMSIVSSLEWELQKSSYCTIVCDCANNVSYEREKLQFLLDKQVAGLVIQPCSYMGKHIADVVSQDIPVVLIDRICEDVEFDSVIINNLEVSMRATEHLLHSTKKVAIICSQNIYTADERKKGYLQAHEIHKIPINKNYIKLGNNTIDGGYHAMMELWNEPSRPEALFITNYEMTIGAMMAINELGINITTDISIIGFDSIDLVKIVKPSLTAICQPMADIGIEAAKQIMKRVRQTHSTPPKKIVLEALLDIK